MLPAQSSRLVSHHKQQHYIYGSDPIDLKAYCDSNSHCNKIYDGRAIQLKPVSIPDMKLEWRVAPKNVLLIIKEDRTAVIMARMIVNFLHERNLTVYTESEIVQQQLNVSGVKIFEIETHRDIVDLSITVGGDGTVLHLCSMFVGPYPIPPVLAFAAGTLGFLTPLNFENHRALIDQVLNATSAASNDHNGDVGIVTVCTRMRLLCTVFKYNEKGDLQATQSFQPLNEVLISRGSSPFLCIVDLFLKHKHNDIAEELVSTVSADGLLVSSSTGSTAYSLGAGGPMVSPSAPAMLVTPICPTSLSFRPVVLPDTSSISLRVACKSRSHAVAFFDGHGQQDLLPGEYIRVQMSPWPLPSINVSDSTSESLWFKAITSKLHWNVTPGAHSPPLGGYTSLLHDACIRTSPSASATANASPSANASARTSAPSVAADQPPCASSSFSHCALRSDTV